MNQRKQKIIIILALIIFIPLLLIAIFMSPEEVKAINIFSPFCGKVKSWLPNAPGCMDLTLAVEVATFGSITLTVEELKIGPPKGGTFGILRINGYTIPGLPTFYKYNSYMTPGSWVIGSSINICDICDKIINKGFKGLSFAKKICESKGIKEILDAGCDLVGENCPINNLIYKIGTSLPSL